MSIARKILSPLALTSLVLASLAACASGGSPGGGHGARGGRAVESQPLPSIGDPGKVAATDIAFARAARDEGQWTAFAEYAGIGALLHGDNGVMEAGPWLGGRADPAQAVRWVPRAVFASCDGTLAASEGRFVEPDGTVGSYVTVWQPDSRGDYKWIYAVGGPDDPQPPASVTQDIPQGDAVIVVEAINAIEGKVADCMEGSVQLTPVSAAPPDGAVAGGGGTSRDGTLRWQWEQRANGTRRFHVTYRRDGDWQVPVDFTASPVDD